jgi:HAD superfamily hydrolase (TIGR01509 family)
MKTWKLVPDLKELTDFYPNINFCIFDLDGTLIDSEEIHMEGLQEASKSAGCMKSIDWLFDNFNGVSDDNCYLELKKDFSKEMTSLEFKKIKNEFCCKKIEQKGPMILQVPIRELLRSLRDSDWRIALVTASERSFMQSALRAMEENFFEFTMCANDTEKTKPDPMPYLKAFERLGIKTAKECLIFEDSPTGLMAAQASGAIVNKVEWFL